MSLSAMNYLLYMLRNWTASFSIRFRNGTCIIILDKKYNIANSSGHKSNQNQKVLFKVGTFYNSDTRISLEA
jgi:hypothetical protein